MKRVWTLLCMSLLSMVLLVGLVQAVPTAHAAGGTVNVVYRDQSGKVVGTQTLPASSACQNLAPPLTTRTTAVTNQSNLVINVYVTRGCVGVPYQPPLSHGQTVTVNGVAQAVEGA